MKKIKNTYIVLTLVVLVAVLGGLWWSRANQMGSTTVEEVGETTIPTPTSLMLEEGVKVVELEAGSFYYKPNELRVKKGEKVRVVMKSVDMMHDFNIDELNVHMPIVKSGSTGTIEFTAETVGEFEYYCAVGQHRKMGQIGKLIVEE